MKKIYSKDWLQLHPYAQSTTVDAYYTNIANRVYDILVATELVNSFEDEEAKQTALRLTAYFEDIISQTNIWKAFITSFKDDYGHYLPFLATGDHYYDDEVNQEDIQFLLWHYLQQYHGWRKGTFVNPDNPVTHAAANMIYKLFCDEWTIAPENERMQQLFDSKTRYDTMENYNSLLHWFYYQSYLIVDSKNILNDTLKDLLENGNIQKQGSQIMLVHDHLAHIGRTVFRAWTTPTWLSKIIPENHPDYALFKSQAEEAERNADVPNNMRVNNNKAEYEEFKEAVPDSLILYMKDETEFFDFLTQKLGKKLPENMSKSNILHDFGVYASPEDGIQTLTLDVDCIKDENNPYYNPEKAKKAALGFFIVKHCSTSLLVEMVKRGMLPDAQTKSLLGDERGKSIIQDNWQFLIEYFHKERITID